jgi:hypothetical protein
MQSAYCVRVGLGRRNHDVVTPESGPCTPAYLQPDVAFMDLWVTVDAEIPEAAQERAATLAAHAHADALSYPSDTQAARRPTSPLAVCADMVTSLTVVDVIP